MKTLLPLFADSINSGHTRFKAQFGTLSDYFESLFKFEAGEIQTEFPMYRGDFLPYTEVPYWTVRTAFSTYIRRDSIRAALISKRLSVIPHPLQEVPKLFLLWPN